MTVTPPRPSRPGTSPQAPSSSPPPAGRGQEAPPPAREEGREPGLRVYLFDEGEEGREIQLREAVGQGMNERQLLWVDAPRREVRELEQVARTLGLDEALLKDLADPTPQPEVQVHGEVFRVDVQAPREQGGRLLGDELNIVVGPNFLLTVHPEDVGFVEDFAEQQRGNDRLGQLTSGTFLAALLNWHLGSFLEQMAALEGKLDGLDEAILGQPSGREFLDELVRHRRRAGELRRLLTDHRIVYAGLSRPDFKALADSETALHFDALEGRFERAVASVERLREAILGSFELYMTSLGQRTNDTMRILTIATVLMGLWALVAGIFGMNFDATFQHTGWHGFEIVVAVLLLVSVLVLWFARRRKWW